MVLDEYIAWIIKEAKVITKIIININTPLSGSFANAWTEFKTPERTRKVPSKLKENVNIAKREVQFLI